MHPDCVLDVRFRGLFINKYEKGKVSQLWVHKNDHFFNQDKVMNAFSTMQGSDIDTSRLSNIMKDHQIFYVELDPKSSKAIKIKQDEKKEIKEETVSSNIYIKNKGNGLVLDVEGEGGAGTNVSIRPFHNRC